MSKIMKTIEYSIFLSLVLMVIFAVSMAFSPVAEAAGRNYVYGPTGNGFDDLDEDFDEDDDYEDDDFNERDPANRTPFISTLNPRSINAGTGPVTIAVNGGGFHPGSRALVNGSLRQTSYVSSSRVLVTFDSSDTQTAGTYSVVIDNGGRGGFSNSSFLTVHNTVVGTTTKKTTTNTTTTRNTSTTRTNTDTSDEVDPDEHISSLAGASIYGTQNSFMPSGIIQWLFIAIFILLAMIAWRSLSGREKYNSTPLKHA